MISAINAFFTDFHRIATTEIHPSSVVGARRITNLNSASSAFKVVALIAAVVAAVFLGMALYSTMKLIVCGAIAGLLATTAYDAYTTSDNILSSLTESDRIRTSALTTEQYTRDVLEGTFLFKRAYDALLNAQQRPPL